MADIYSKRQKSSQKQLDAYTYDYLPQQLKVQIVHACDEIFESPGFRMHHAEVFLNNVCRKLCEEYGVFHLTPNPSSSTEDVYNFFLKENEVAKCFDVIELVFADCVHFVRTSAYGNTGRHSLELFHTKLNARFLEHAVGYEFRDGKIIRIDSALLHQEIVIPAMFLLREPYLMGANEEFLKAHEHLRHGRFAESINECLKAFESTMKAICHKRGWPYSQNDTAKLLLAACEKNGLFPSYMQSSLSGLRSVLENVATFRNKLSGHGQGAQQVRISQEIAAFVIQSTGANVLFLASLEKNLP